MFRKKSPRLAAAFVVTISAGCGGASTQDAKDPDRDDVPRTDAVMSQFINRGDGKCFIEIFANPPFQTPVDCETKQPIKEVGTNGTSKTATDGPTKPDGPKNPDWVPNIGSVKGGFEKGADGKCVIVHPANPPWREPVDCDTQEPLKKPETDKPKPPDPLPPPATTGTLAPRPPDETNLPDAPKGMKVRKNSDGSCMAFSSSSKCPPDARCNPPPPIRVKCPRDLPKEVADPAKI